MTDLTQQQVENFILLAGQSGERWFKLSFIDDGMNSDPTANALMDVLSDAIHDGIMSMDFTERYEQAAEDTKSIIGAHKNDAN